MSKKLYLFLISILFLLPTLYMTVGSVPASSALSKPGQTGDYDVAFAQEDSASYPGPYPLERESFDTAIDHTSNDLEAPTETRENPERPSVAGTNQYPADNLTDGSDSDVQNTKIAVPTGDLAGKVYLWVAFVAALLIFTAAVLGAILLYTRQRYKE